MYRRWRLVCSFRSRLIFNHLAHFSYTCLSNLIESKLIVSLTEYCLKNHFEFIVSFFDERIFLYVNDLEIMNIF